MEGCSCSKQMQELRQEFPEIFGPTKPRSHIPDTIKFSCLCGVPRQKTVGETILSIVNSYPTKTQLAPPEELARHLSYLLKVKPSYYARQRRQPETYLPCCCCDIILDCFVNNKLLTQTEYETIMSQNCDCGCKDLLSKSRIIPRNVDYIVNMVLNDNNYVMNGQTDPNMNGLNMHQINNNKINCKTCQGINRRDQLCPINENHETNIFSTQSGSFLTRYIEPSSMMTIPFKADGNYKYISNETVNQNQIDTTNNKNVPPGINQNNIILCKQCMKTQEVKNSKPKHKLFPYNSNKKFLPSIFTHMKCRKCRKPKLGKNVKGKPKVDKESFRVFAKVNKQFKALTVDMQQEIENEDPELCQIGYKHFYKCNHMNVKESSKQSEFLQNENSTSPHNFISNIIQNVPPRSTIIKDLRQSCPLNPHTNTMNDKLDQPFPIDNCISEQEITQPTMRDKLVDIIINTSVSNLERMSCLANSNDRQDTNVRYLEPILDAILNDNNLQEIFKERLFNQLVDLLMKPPEQIVNKAEMINELLDQLQMRRGSPIIKDAINCQKLPSKVESDHNISVDPIKHDEQHEDLLKQIIYDISRHQSFTKRMISTNNDDIEDLNRTSKINSKLELSGICTTKNVSEVENINFNEQKSTASSNEPAGLFQTCVRKKVNVQVSTQFICDNSSPSSLYLTFADQCEMKRIPTTNLESRNRSNVQIQASNAKQIKSTNTNESNVLLFTKENRKIAKETESSQICNNSKNNNFSQTIEWNQCENILVSPSISSVAQTKSKRFSMAVGPSLSSIKIRQSESKPFDPIPKGNTESLLMFHENEIIKRVVDQSNECVEVINDNLEERIDQQENGQNEKSIMTNETLTTCENISQMFSKFIGPNSKLGSSQSLCQLKLLMNNTLLQVVKQIFGNTLFLNSPTMPDEKCDEDCVASSPKQESHKTISTQANIIENTATSPNEVTINNNSAEIQSVKSQPLKMHNIDNVNHTFKHTITNCSEACQLEPSNLSYEPNSNTPSSDLTLELSTDTYISELNKPKTNKGESCHCKDLSEIYISSHNDQNKSVEKVIFYCKNQAQEPNTPQKNNTKENLDNDTPFSSHNIETSDFHFSSTEIQKDLVYTNSKLDQDKGESLSQLLAKIKKRNEIRVQLNNLYKETFQYKEMDALNIVDQSDNFPEKKSSDLRERFKSISEDSGLNSVVSYQSLRNIISIDAKLRKIIKRLPESKKIVECNVSDKISIKELESNSLLNSQSTENVDSIFNLKEYNNSGSGFIENKTFIVNSLETSVDYKELKKHKLINNKPSSIKRNNQAVMNNKDSKSQNIEQTYLTCSYINSFLFKTCSEEIETCILCTSGNCPTRPYSRIDRAEENVREKLASKLNVLFDEISIEIKKNNLESEDTMDLTGSETSFGSNNKFTKTELGRIFKQKWLGKHGRTNKNSYSSSHKNILTNKRNLLEIENVSEDELPPFILRKKNINSTGKKSKIVSKNKVKHCSNSIQELRKKALMSKSTKSILSKKIKDEQAKNAIPNQTVRKKVVKISPSLVYNANDTIEYLRNVEKYKNNHEKQGNRSNLLQLSKPSESLVSETESSSDICSTYIIRKSDSLQNSSIDYSVHNIDEGNSSSNLESSRINQTTSKKELKSDRQSSRINHTILKKELQSDGRYCIFEGPCISEEDTNIWQSVIQNSSSAQKCQNNDKLADSSNNSLKTDTSETELAAMGPIESETNWFENDFLRSNSKAHHGKNNRKIETTEEVPKIKKTPVLYGHSDSNKLLSKLDAKFNSPSWQKHTLQYYLEHGDKQTKFNKDSLNSRVDTKLQIMNKLPSETSFIKVPNKSNISSLVKHSTEYHDIYKITPCSSKEKIKEQAVKSKELKPRGNSNTETKKQNNLSLPKDLIQHYEEQDDKDSKSIDYIPNVKKSVTALETLNEAAIEYAKNINKFDDSSSLDTAIQFDFDCPKYKNNNSISQVNMSSNNLTTSEVMNELLSNEKYNKAKIKYSDSAISENDETTSLNEESYKPNERTYKNSESKPEIFKSTVKGFPGKGMDKNYLFSSQNDTVEHPNDMSRRVASIQNSINKEKTSKCIKDLSSNESLGKSKILSNKQNTSTKIISNLKQASKNIWRKCNASPIRIPSVEYCEEDSVKEKQSPKSVQKSIKKAKSIETNIVKYYVDDSVRQNRITAIVPKHNNVLDSDKNESLTSDSMEEPHCEIESTSSYNSISEPKPKFHQLDRRKLTDSQKKEALFQLLKQLTSDKNKGKVVINYKDPNCSKKVKTETENLSISNKSMKFAGNSKTTVKDEKCNKKCKSKIDTNKKNHTSKFHFSPSIATVKIVKKDSNENKKTKKSQGRKVVTDWSRELLFDELNGKIQEVFNETKVDKPPNILKTSNINNKKNTKKNHKKPNQEEQTFRNEIVERFKKKFDLINNKWQNTQPTNKFYQICRTKSEEDDFSFSLQTLLDRSTLANVSRVTKPPSLSSKLLQDNPQKAAIRKPMHPSFNAKLKGRSPIITGSTKELVGPGTSIHKQNAKLIRKHPDKELDKNVLSFLKESVKELTYASDIYELLRLTLDEVLKRGPIHHNSI